jgi:hypothetical protein
MMKFLAYIWRVFRWWFRCLWEGKVIPRKEEKLFSRTYMRKAWRDRLRSLDRVVNEWSLSPLYIREATRFLLR